MDKILESDEFGSFFGSHLWDFVLLLSLMWVVAYLSCRVYTWYQDWLKRNQRQPDSASVTKYKVPNPNPNTDWRQEMTSPNAKEEEESSLIDD